MVNKILDILPIGVFVLDSKFQVAEVNTQLEEYFGFSRADVVGRDKRELIRQKISKIFENGDKFCLRVLATYDNNTYIERFICHVLAGENRSERWLEHTSQPISMGVYEGGRVEIYADITDRILAEQEIHWIATQFMQLQEKEKSRIARNLHDGLGQEILAIKFSLEHLQETLKNRPASLDSENATLEKTIAWVEQMGFEVRNISSDLMPSMLAPLGLEETLIWLKDQYATLYGLDIQYQSLGMKEKRLPEALEVAIFRIFQESLINIVKHASAQHVDMKLVYSYPWIIATITDDGKGFDPESSADVGIGLKIMKQRIMELDGSLKITSKIQRGTTIRAKFPAPDNHSEKRA